MSNLFESVPNGSLTELNRWLTEVHETTSAAWVQAATRGLRSAPLYGVLKDTTELLKEAAREMRKRNGMGQ
jgi:hypothetical protein